MTPIIELVVALALVGLPFLPIQWTWGTSGAIFYRTICWLLAFILGCFVLANFPVLIK
jgi:hypothetical protein